MLNEGFGQSAEGFELCGIQNQTAWLSENVFKIYSFP